MKKIKKSNRGLTFSLSNESKIGTKFRYIIDKKNNRILIVEDEKGTGTVSRKRSGNRFNALYDIRSKEVRELVSSADYMEVEESGEQIIVHIYRAIKSVAFKKKSNIVRIQDILAVKTGEIVLSAVSGGTSEFSFGHPTLVNEEYFEYLQRSAAPKSWNYKKEKKSVKAVYDTISLFSGAGMLDYGFRDPRVNFVYANDACLIDGVYQEGIKETYEYNMGHKMDVKDIRMVNPSDVPDADIVIGGPCCQGYSGIVSNAEKRYSEEAEKKRLLIDDYVKFVVEKHPKAFVIENVPELLTEKDGIYIQKHVLDVLTDYEITCSLVKDCDLGGYTSRRRAIIIGSRVGKIELPDKEFHVLKTCRDALLKVDDTWPNWNDGSQGKEGTKMLMRCVPDGGNWMDIPEEVVVKYRSSHKPFGKSTQSNTYKRLDPKKPAITIPNWRKAVMMPPREFGVDRQLTVSEVAALQGLPKEFKLFGNLAAKQQMLGNGVPFAIATHIKDTVLSALDASSKIVKFA